MKKRTTLLTLLAVCLMLVACDTKTKTVDSCGDGFVDPGEDCDDGNAYDMDGCAATCVVETGWWCTKNSPNTCLPFCGDNLLVGDEICDGENLDGQDCVTLGYSIGSGALSCTVTCGFDEGLCLPKSGNCNLASLTVSEGTLVPEFGPYTVTYTVQVPLSLESLTVAATAQDSLTSLSIVPDQPMSLTEGQNTARVTTTAENGGQRFFYVTITRQ